MNGQCEGGYAPQRSLGSTLGGNVGREALMDATAKVSPPVHSAQEMLDKAIAALYSEVDQLESQLQPVLTQQAEKAGNPIGANAPAYSVATKIGASAEAIGAIASCIRNITGRLEV